MASLVAQLVKTACNTGDPGQSMGWEAPLEKEMAIHSSILAWRIPGTKEPGGATVHGVARVGHDLAPKPHHHPMITEGTLFYLQFSDLVRTYFEL